LAEKVDVIAAAVLAGGKNSRMPGINKAFIKIGASTIIQRTIGLLRGIFKDVILVTNSPEDFKAFRKDAVIVGDIIKGAGPLGGIHSALTMTSKDAVFITACDMPFLRSDIIHRQIDCFSKTGGDCLVSRSGSFLEPLHGVYKSSLKGEIGSFLENSGDLSIRSFLATINVCYFDLADDVSSRNIFKNLNTPQDLRNISQDYGPAKVIRQ